MSAYLDAELTGSEMLDIRAHLEVCPGCRVEYQTLRDTKRLLSSLALRAPRAEFEALLGAEVARNASPLKRFLPSWLDFRRYTAVSLTALPRRPTPLLAAAALSVAGLVLATATLDAPSDTVAARAASPEVYPRYVEEHIVYRSPYTEPVPETTTWNAGNSVMLSSFNPGYGRAVSSAFNPHR